MEKQVLFAAITAATFFCTTAGMAQYSGTAAGQNPAGNSNFGGGNSSSGDFTTYAAASRALHEEKYDEAVAYLQQLLQTRPRSPDVLDKLGFQVYVHNVGPTASYAAVLDAFYAGQRDERTLALLNAHPRKLTCPTSASTASRPGSRPGGNP